MLYTAIISLLKLLALSSVLVYSSVITAGEVTDESVDYVVFPQRESFSERELHWAYLASAVMIADWGTTRNLTARYQEGRWEMNPILGPYPTRSQVDRHFIIGLATIWTVGWLLPREARVTFFGSIAAVQLIVVGRNLHGGLRIQF